MGQLDERGEGREEDEEEDEAHLPEVDAVRAAVELAVVAWGELDLLDLPAARRGVVGGGRGGRDGEALARPPRLVDGCADAAAREEGEEARERDGDGALHPRRCEGGATERGRESSAGMRAAGGLAPSPRHSSLEASLALL